MKHGDGWMVTNVCTQATAQAPFHLLLYTHDGIYCLTRCGCEFDTLAPRLEERMSGVAGERDVGHPDRDPAA